MLVAGEAAGAGVEPGLQDEDGGDLVDDALAADRRVAGIVEVAMRLGGGEALVPKMHGDTELRPEVIGEGLGLGSLRTLVAGHVERVADDGLGDVVLAEDAGDGLEVRAAAGAMEGEERLRGEAERVGERDADAAVANVEGGDARGEIRRFSRAGLGGFGHMGEFTGGMARDFIS